MKSMIISAVFGTAILAIHGVTGAVMPLNTVKRNEAFEVRSEALEEAQSPAIERAAPALTTRVAPNLPSTNLPAGLSTITCVHTTEGLIQCDDIIIKREKPAAPSMDSVEKRGKKLPLRDGYPDRAGKCDKLHNQYHWAQTSNHPQYCHQLMDKNPPDQLWDWCYVLVPCNVPNGARPYQTPLIHSPGRRSILEERTGSEEATTDRGCNGKGTTFYFTNDTSKILCNGELVKGSETYRRRYPGAVGKKEKPPWHAIAQEAQEYRDASLAKVQPPVSIGINAAPNNVSETLRSSLSSQELAVTELPIKDLLQQIRTRNITAVAITNAFLRRAALAQMLTNCVTELLPERSLAQAAFLDEYLQNNGRPIGPLHGLPISVKEHIGMKEVGLNAGYVAWWNKTATEDARVLQILSRAGAVFHARTTQPQTLMHLETDSNLFGVTVNPYNTKLSPGGSSGGEGALVGVGGSCLGIGTDIGGSIRSPAANNGIYGLKPTAFRIPTDGWSSTAPGADPIATVIGPLSTSLGGLKLFMETVLLAQPWLQGPALLPIPWNSSYHISSQRPLKIAIMLNDGIAQPNPPITRALKTLALRLATMLNVTIVDWIPHLHDEAWAIISSLYFTDGGAEDAATMAESGEP